MKQAKEQFISVSYDELLAENDMPRGVVTGLADRSFSEYEMNLLQSDNAKLRELCADIYEMAYHEYPSAFEVAFADRMRELGVEVDG